jgi:hypothetical protein
LRDYFDTGRASPPKTGAPSTSLVSSENTQAPGSNICHGMRNTESESTSKSTAYSPSTTTGDAESESTTKSATYSPSTTGLSTSRQVYGGNDCPTPSKAPLSDGASKDRSGTSEPKSTYGLPRPCSESPQPRSPLPGPQGSDTSSTGPRESHIVSSDTFLTLVHAVWIWGKGAPPLRSRECEQQSQPGAVASFPRPSISHTAVTSASHFVSDFSIAAPSEPRHLDDERETTGIDGRLLRLEKAVALSHELIEALTRLKSQPGGRSGDAPHAKLHEASGTPSLSECDEGEGTTLGDATNALSRTLARMGLAEKSAEKLYAAVCL